MLAIHTFMRPVAKASARIASRLGTKTPVTQRADWCPYLGHVPYFAPKMTRAQKSHLAS